jgi:hypothetical protein
MTNPHPEWLPAVGTIVYLKVSGSRKKPVAYTIREYKEFAPGEWLFKADAPRGSGVTDGIDILR